MRLKPFRIPSGVLPVSYRQTERNILQYPVWALVLHELEEAQIREASSSGGLSGDRVQGGEHLHQQDRYMQIQEQSPLYTRLSRNCEIVEQAMGELTKQEREFVDLFFWKDLECDAYSHEVGVARVLGFAERTVWRWKNRVLRKLEPLLRGVDPAVFEREKCQ